MHALADVPADLLEVTKQKSLAVYIYIYIYICIHTCICVYIYIHRTYVYMYGQIYKLILRALAEDPADFLDVAKPCYIYIHTYIHVLSRRWEHPHARALQIRAELSTHIHRETGPPATHTQFLEFSFWEDKTRVRQKATGFSPAPGALYCTPCRPQQASPQRSRAQSPDKGIFAKNHPTHPESPLSLT